MRLNIYKINLPSVSEPHSANENISLEWGELVDEKDSRDSSQNQRAYKLSNGDVVSMNLLGAIMLLEYEDNTLYEVVEEKTVYGLNLMRTGISYTIEEINNMMKE